MPDVVFEWKLRWCITVGSRPYASGSVQMEVARVLCMISGCHARCSVGIDIFCRNYNDALNAFLLHWRNITDRYVPLERYVLRRKIHTGS